MLTGASKRSWCLPCTRVSKRECCRSWECGGHMLCLGWAGTPWLHGVILESLLSKKSRLLCEIVSFLKVGSWLKPTSTGTFGLRDSSPWSEFMTHTGTEIISLLQFSHPYSCAHREYLEGKYFFILKTGSSLKQRRPTSRFCAFGPSQHCTSPTVRTSSIPLKWIFLLCPQPSKSPAFFSGAYAIKIGESKPSRCYSFSPLLSSKQSFRKSNLRNRGLWAGRDPTDSLVQSFPKLGFQGGLWQFSKC